MKKNTLDILKTSNNSNSTTRGTMTFIFVIIGLLLLTYNLWYGVVFDESMSFSVYLMLNVFYFVGLCFVELSKKEVLKVNKVDRFINLFLIINMCYYAVWILIIFLAFALDNLHITNLIIIIRMPFTGMLAICLFVQAILLIKQRESLSGIEIIYSYSLLIYSVSIVIPPLLLPTFMANYILLGMILLQTGDDKTCLSGKPE